VIDLVRQHAEEIRLHVVKEGKHRTEANERSHYFVLQWSSSNLRWSQFLDEFIGSDDPAAAAPTSIRGRLFLNYKSLGCSQPSLSANGVHASVSPFEAWCEMRWMKQDTPFSKALNEIVPLSVLEDWSKNSIVEYGHRDFLLKKKAFDIFHGKDGEEVLALAQMLTRSDGCQIIPNTDKVEKVAAADLRDFTQQIARLKEVPRTGWVRRGVDNVESVACHSYGVALLSLVMGPLAEGLHVDKMIKMALLHDFAEHEVGDIVVDGSCDCRDDITREEKSSQETAVMKASTELLRRPDLLELWEEYETGKSPEARFVKDLDRLEMLYQAAYYIKTQHKNLDDFYESTKGKFDHPLCREQEKILRREHDERFAKRAKKE